MSEDEGKGEKEKENMNEYLGQRTSSRPPTRSTTPSTDQQQGDSGGSFDESENERRIEEILNTHLDGFKISVENSRLQACDTPKKKENLIKIMANKMKSYLRENPLRHTDKKEKHPEYTEEEIYETLQNDDQERQEKLEQKIEKLQAQFENFNREQDTVNKVVTKTKKTKTRKQKKEDSSDDSLDDEDTGETSGQELVSERNERKRKVENGKYKTARPDITTKADKRVTNLIKTIAAEEAQMGIKADENQKMLQTALVTAIQRQTYNDSRIKTVFYPKIKLTKNNERLYDPNLVSSLQKRIFIDGNYIRYDGESSRLRLFLQQYDILGSSYLTEGEYNQLVYFGLTDKAKHRLGLINVTIISTGEFMTRLYLVFNTNPSTVKDIQEELTSIERGGKDIVSIFTDINGTLSNLPQDKMDQHAEMLFDTLQASIPPEVRSTIRGLLRTDSNGEREYPEQADYIDYLRTHGQEIDEVRKKQGNKGQQGFKKTVNQVQNEDYDAMGMWRDRVNNIKLEDQTNRENTTPAYNTRNDTQEPPQRELKFCWFCQMDGHYADMCFRNPKGDNYRGGNYKSQNNNDRDVNCGLCRSKAHLAPRCDVYPKAIIVAEPCQHCFKAYQQKFHHQESICMLVQRRKTLAEPSK